MAGVSSRQQNTEHGGLRPLHNAGAGELGCHIRAECQVTVIGVSLWWLLKILYSHTLQSHWALSPAARASPVCTHCWHHSCLSHLLLAPITPQGLSTSPAPEGQSGLAATSRTCSRHWSHHWHLLLVPCAGPNCLVSSVGILGSCQLNHL
uniref:Uncharacterized protein n=1 Tax=Pipistrellus kuhlii TaxID=59472 RepID=A0A7J7ZJ45_PIPKU|nr:hypothetical protein mPipKuh1_009506 [Pipistrellus kuhlii]